MSKPFRTAAAFALSLISWSAVSAAEQQDPRLVERGRYLVEVAAFCGACHAGRGPKGEPLQGMELAGGRVIEDRGFRAVVPNITPDPETGIGSWTNEQIAAAVRDGHRPDGSLIGPPMPVESYRGISDRDLTAIVAFLRTMPPIRHAVSERSHYPFKLALTALRLSLCRIRRRTIPLSAASIWRYISLTAWTVIPPRSPRENGTRVAPARRALSWKARGAPCRRATSVRIRSMASVVGRMSRSFERSPRGNRLMGGNWPRRWLPVRRSGRS
jgi:mono/diheme cytochrome c family protein